jgi:hypothetical protein
LEIHAKTRPAPMAAGAGTINRPDAIFAEKA